MDLWYVKDGNIIIMSYVFTREPYKTIKSMTREVSSKSDASDVIDTIILFKKKILIWPDSF